MDPRNIENPLKREMALNESLEHYKNLLVRCTSHQAKVAVAFSWIKNEARARQKHYAKMANILADAIRFKNPMLVEQTLGDMAQAELDSIEARELFADAMGVFMENWRDDKAAEDPRDRRRKWELFVDNNGYVLDARLREKFSDIEEEGIKVREIY